VILGIGIVILYLVIGAVLAKRDLPRAWDRAHRRHGPAGYMADIRREEVKGSMILMFLLWPIAIPHHFINGLLTHAVVEADPAERERQLRSRERKLELAEHDAKVKKLEQQRYIERLEEELGIGGHE
jgi:hypothetical protein